MTAAGVSGHEDAVFLSWVKHHRRSAELVDATGVAAIWVSSARSHLVSRYIDQTRSTWRALRAHRPRLIWVMQPPFPALAVAYVYARRHGAVIAADLHTGFFDDQKWKRFFPLALRLVRSRGGFVTVTNSDLAAVCAKHGVDAFITHGKVGEPVPSARLGLGLDASVPVILAPLAYAYDEPLGEILAAAEATPEYQWVLTGRAPTSIQDRAPDNVTFPGYVSLDDYRALRSQATCFIALTTHERTMQSVGYEALAQEAALVTSPMKVLREYFGDAVVYTEPTADGIVDAVRSAVDDADSLRARMKGLRMAKLLEERVQHEAIRQRISATVGDDR